jgi:hypothetical protein
MCTHILYCRCLPSLRPRSVPDGPPPLPSGGLAGAGRERSGDPFPLVGLVFPYRFSFQRHQQGGAKDDAME